MSLQLTCMPHHSDMLLLPGSVCFWWIDGDDVIAMLRILQVAGHFTSCGSPILASDWSRQVTWPEYWPLIGWCPPWPPGDVSWQALMASWSLSLSSEALMVLMRALIMAPTLLLAKQKCNNRERTGRDETNENIFQKELSAVLQDSLEWNTTGRGGPGWKDPSSETLTCYFKQFFNSIAFLLALNLSFVESSM